MVRLIAADMDGTLLDENSLLPEETFELIEKLRDRGVIFCASSGRRYETLRWMFEPVADRMDYVGSLGTQVYADGVLLDREVFSTRAVLRLFRTCQEFDCFHLVLYDRTHTYLLNDQSSYVRELDKDLPNAERIFDPPSPDVSIIKAAICYDRTHEIMDMVYVLERELGDVFSFMPSGNTWIDDYAMLRYVGHPYVMGNARYAVKQIAERVVGTNVEHAVQKEMRRILEELG